MIVEIEVQWSEGDETLKRTKSASEILSGGRSRDLEVGQTIVLLDAAWQETRAALVVLMSPEARRQINVGALLTPEMADLVEKWQREK